MKNTRQMPQGPVQPAGPEASEHWYLFGDTRFDLLKIFLGEIFIQFKQTGSEKYGTDWICSLE